jgi:hypothetical protein
MHMGRPKLEPAEVDQLTVRFPKGLLDVLRASADENDRSLNAEIVNAVRTRAKAFQAQKEQHELVHA